MGAAWSRAGEIADGEAWNEYVSACARRVQSPVRVSVSP
ncbi:MAG: hypothetical protein ACREIA_16460 [Opitutaceae bacterium]